MFERSPEAIMRLDTSGNIIDVNGRLLDWLGYKQAEIIDRNLLEAPFFPEESRSKAVESFIRRMIVEEITACELTFTTKNGEKRTGLIGAAPVKDIEETSIYDLVMISDITERKRAEEGMERAAREWRETFDAISDYISIHDDNFIITRVNKAFASLFKLIPQEVIGRTCYELVHGTKEPCSGCPHQLALRTMKAQRREFFNQHMSMHLDVLCSPIANEKGNATATVHIMRDITERKKMENRLIVTDRLASIGELSSGIAHELNNPLTGIIGLSELVLDEDLPHDVEQDLRAINREAKRTAGVVRNLLIFARGHEQEKQLVDINEVIQNVLNLRAYEQRVNNIEVSTQFASDLPEIMADNFQLQQVFLNIIINAEHFMIEAHGRGALIITTERVGNIVRASVADDGPGITREDLGNIFNPFFTTKEVGKGTGLGLSICYGIISEHGGRIYAESRLNKGAKFIIEIPVDRY